MMKTTSIFSKKLCATLAISGASLLAAASSQAATLNWDGGTTSGSSFNLGGTGTWNTNTTSNWDNGSAFVNWTDTTGVDTANFAGTAGTVTIASGGVTANALTFNTTGYTIAGTDTTSTLTLAGAGASISTGVSVSGSSTTALTSTISTILAGNTNVSVLGGGNLTLSGSNTLSGGITINAAQNGTGSSGGVNQSAITVTNANALGTGGITFGAVNNGRMLSFNFGAGTGTVANNINLGSATGQITLNAFGTGSITTSSKVYLTGQITGTSAGTLYFDGSASHVLDVFRLSNANNNFQVGSIFVNRSILAITSAAALGNSSNQITLDQNVSTAGFRFDANNITVQNAFNIAATTSFQVYGDNTGSGTPNTANNATVSGNLTGGAAFEVIGGATKGGSLTLTGSNSNSGAITVANTTLITGNSNALGTSAVILSGTLTDGVTTAGGTLQVGNGTVNTLTGIGALTLNNAASVLDLKTKNGSVSLASGKIFTMTLGTWMLSNATSNQITLSGGGTYALTSGTIDLSGFTQGPGTYNIITGGSGTVGSLTFINGQVGDIYSFDTAGDLIVAVPEPSTFVLAGIFGAGMLILFRRRSSRA